MKKRTTKWGRLFDEFNGRYFGGRLHPYRVEVVSNIDALGCRGKHYGSARTIRLRDLEDEQEMVGVLLHEMAHAASNDRHTSKWKAEMNRLNGLGAPISDADLTEWMGPTKLTRALVLCEAAEYLAMVSGASVPGLAWHIVRSYGFADDNRELLKKYPWIRSAFRDASIDHQRAVDARSIWEAGGQ